MACFDFEPVPYLDENLAPQFKATSYEPGTLLTIDDANVVMTAIAYDEDAAEGDTLDFLWFAGPQFLSSTPLPGLGNEGDEIVLHGSVVTLPYDLDLDGLELSCTVIDAEGADVEATWPLEVL